jgi:hypothetical protein
MFPPTPTPAQPAVSTPLQGDPGQPPSATPANAPLPQGQIPMTTEELATWWSRIELSQNARKQREKKWDELLRAYLPTEDALNENLNSNIHFRNTEQKKAMLFEQAPDLILTPLEPLQAQQLNPQTQQPYTQEQIVALKKAVLDKALGADGVDVERLMDEVKFDVLQTSGIGCTEIAYEADFQPVQDETGQTQPVPVYEAITWKRFSPKKILIPHDWRSTRYDDAPWLGREFALPLAVAIREFNLDPNFTPNATSDTRVFEGLGQDKSQAGTMDVSGLVEGVLVWYRPGFFPNTGVTHRQVQRKLVLIRSLERPAKHQMSPYQSLGPDAKLTATSIIGYPIHLFSLRDLSDSAYPPADAAMTDPLVKHMNTWMSQDVKLRDANIPRFVYADTLKEAIEKLASSDVGEGAGVPEDLMMRIDKLFQQLPHLEQAQADVNGRNAIQQAIDQTLALGPNQAGAMNTKVLSATEINNAQSSSNTRGQSEQTRFLSDYLKGVRKFDALYTRFMQEPDYVQVLGPQGAQQLVQFNSQLISGRYAYDAKVDSSKRIDAAQQRQQFLQYINLMANAPESNRQELMREGALLFGLDPSRVLQTPPPRQPGQAKTSVAFVGADLVGPQAGLVVEMLQQDGYSFSPQALQAALTAISSIPPPPPTPMGPGMQPFPQAQHPGTLESGGAMSPLSKHTAALTGEPDGRRPM